MRQSSISGPIGGQQGVQDSGLQATQPSGMPDYSPPSNDLCLLNLSSPFPSQATSVEAPQDRDDLRERIARHAPQTFVGRLLQQLSAGEVPDDDCADLLREIALIGPAAFATGLAATEALLKRLRFEDPCLEIPDKHLVVQDLPLTNHELLSPLPEILRVALSSPQVSPADLLTSLLSRDPSDRLWSAISRALDFHLGRIVEPQDLFDLTVPDRNETWITNPTSEPSSLRDIQLAEKDPLVKSPAA